MVKNRHLACHVLDSGWRLFKGLLNYKSKIVIEVEPAHTSIDCSKCSNKIPKSLAVRIHRCDRCDIVIDGDYNASLNILRKGLLLLLPQRLREVTPVEIPKESLKQEEAIEQIASSPKSDSFALALGLRRSAYPC
ncbi:putative transposase, IS605 OrfB family [Candidatus Nitrososphaera gargensis Ga9.2]|uniref:Putative transposase, IS605 OrfB family n=1 Tax=Nitrososphaera gargensis (strain Ga9.2) TaxID=1237085 RepID=K0I8C4_NITGG|nr:zinc ribbon domain-containing protein [Candidatus Nitrososphaera gargensis]AFU57526.1 putative transposase, IS605 OrfB family [Candidatus Nitrososphaera gargensis Ga9.2]